MIKKIISKNSKVIGSAVIVLLLVIAIYAVTANQNTPTEEIKSVDIYSDGYEYDEPGSWHINKSAEWISKDKARVTMNLDTISYSNNKPKKILLVIDGSKNMQGDRLLKLRSNISRFTSELLENNDHNYWIKIVYSFNRVYAYDEKFVNYKYGCDYYNASSPCYYIYKQDGDIDEFIPHGDLNYEDMVDLANFNAYSQSYNYLDQPNSAFYPIVIIGDYPSNIVKPNMTLNIQSNTSITYSFIQYDMGSEYIDDFNKLPGEHYIADKDNLYDVLKSTLSEKYDYYSFDITDYIDNDYFTLNSTDDIKVSMGNIEVKTEDGKQKVIWNLGDDSYVSISNAKLTMDLSINDELKEDSGLFSLNDKILVNKQEEGFCYYDYDTQERICEDGPIETVESDKTPVLSHSYSVSFDLNLPEDCSLSDISDESYITNSFVDLESKTPSCSGYSFKGWSIFTKESYDSNESDLEELDIVSNNSFIMPTENIVAKANWTRLSVTKANEGVINTKSYKEPYLANLVSNTKGESKVIFGDTCWEAIGTNQNGGVKLIYDGIPNNEGKCGTNDITHPSYNESFVADIGNNDYYYGSDYKYDTVLQNFTLSGDLIQESIDEDNYSSVVGKYSCMSDNSDDGCITLYYIKRYLGDYNNDGGNYVEMIPISSSEDYYSIGKSEFNNNDSVTSVGYMKDDSDFKTLTKKMDLNTFDILFNSYYDEDIYVSDSFTYSYDTYELDNPQKISELGENYDLIGKYTFLTSNSDFQDNELYYIVGFSDDEVYYVQLYDGLDIDSLTINYTYGSDISPNGDGTYTILGSSQISNTDWYSNGPGLKDVYMCPSGSATCEHPYYIIDANDTSFRYIKTYKFGNSFVYDSTNNVYTLVDTVDQYQWTVSSNYNSSTASSKLDYNNGTKHHYTCFNDTGKCETINYVLTNESDSVQYFVLENGQSMKGYIDNLLDGENANSSDSSIKIVVDTWFRHNLVDYLDYIDDTVFCNNRTVTDYGMFDKDGNYFSEVYFDTGECTDTNDLFSVSSSIGNGKLTYPVGIFEYTDSGFNSWIGTTRLKYIDEHGEIQQNLSSDKLFHVRPVISLKKDLEVYSGFGTNNEPYLIKY